jgi:2-polyprenyl-3-methyl-5-hydroxy-6-metoxy-1,4-benzoquinol methylase
MRTEQTYVKCNLCGSDDFRVIFNEGKAQIHCIVKCNICGLMYANPQKDNTGNVEKNHLILDSDKKDIKTDSEFHQFNPEINPYLKKQYIQLKDYARIIDFVESQDKGTLVEIGSYAGVFLNEAKKRGWNVIGVEPLELPALYSEKEFGIKTIRKYFEESDLQHESIDVVVACHVIEHVPDPSLFVNHAFKLLKSKGKLILETPTYDSYTFKVLKYRERSVKCNGHIYFFTKDTLMKLVEKNGFKVLKHEKVGRTLTMDRLFYNFGIITGKKEFFKRLSKKLRLDKFTIRINMKDMQRIYCLKN